jgi:hypothetical protein
METITKKLTKKYTLEEQEYYDFSFHFESFLKFIHFLNNKILKNLPDRDSLFNEVMHSVIHIVCRSILISNDPPSPLEGGKWTKKKIDILYDNFGNYFIENYMAILMAASKKR